MLIGPRPIPQPLTRADVLPPDLITRLERLDVRSTRVFSGRLPGERRSKRRGQSVEFDDFRPYVAGDDPRHLDWNIVARFDRLVVKLFREDQDLSVRLVIDASASMDAGSPVSKILAAHRLAAALGSLSLCARNRVSASVFGTGELRMLRPLRGRRSIEQLSAFLVESLEASRRARRSRQTGPAFTDAMRRVASAATDRGLIILLTDALEPEGIDRGLNAIAAAGGGGFDGLMCQVLAPAELDPARATEDGFVGDLRLSDAETGRAAEITLSADVLKRYRTRLDAFIQRTAHACRARGVRHVLVPSDADIAGLITGELRQRGVIA